uniref:Transmembrane protein 129 n=1 Tax=Panagrolaimus superbus TaxID=310955 RepID=A0A914Y5K4_9BILA
MELGLPASDIFLSAAIFLLAVLVIVYPPAEARSAGFIIPNIFYSIVGDEKFDFVRHHLRRSCLTILIQALLPMVYTFVMYFYFYEEFTLAGSFDLVKLLFRFSSTVLLIAAGYIFQISRSNFSNHSIIKNLAKYGIVNDVASQINDEIKDILNFKVEYVGYSKLIITSSWIIKVTMYNVVFLKISDARFKLVRTLDHPILFQENSGKQIIDVEAESISGKTKPVIIRVYSREMFEELRQKLGGNVEIVTDIRFKSSLHERFVTVFKQHINNNPKYNYDFKYELEPCLGCQSVESNIKLDKTCMDSVGQVQCRQCHCKPMWCTTCIAMIFASKQNDLQPEQWLSGRAECPTCRALFCVLDVCLLSSSSLPLPPSEDQTNNSTTATT